MPRTRVLKYTLPPHGQATIDAAVVRWLSVAWQGDTLMVWAEVTTWREPEPAPIEQHQLEVVMTGDEVPAHATYLGSATLHPDSPARYVVHVYELQ